MVVMDRKSPWELLILKMLLLLSNMYLFFSLTDIVYAEGTTLTFIFIYSEIAEHCMTEGKGKELIGKRHIVFLIVACYLVYCNLKIYMSFKIFLSLL